MFAVILLLSLIIISNANNTYYKIFTERPPVTEYSKKVINKACLLIPQQGPCRSKIKMYYYDAEAQDCKTFRWGGCQGNGNRYDTMEECLDTCLNKPNATLALRPKYCTLAFDYGFCFGSIKRWYFDRIWKICKERLYSGCGGNKNNFYSRDDCERRCHFGYKYRKAPSFNITRDANVPVARAGFENDNEVEEAAREQTVHEVAVIDET